MTLFTRISPGLWDWERWTDLKSPPTQLLWLALYTTAEAKRLPPGLFHGSITAMSEASHMDSSETLKSLDHLLDVELVEWDQKSRVLRLTELPDAGEYPSAPSILESWWGKFMMLPPCAVRDAHVPTIRWILDRGAACAKKNRSKRPTPLHEEIWASTFATITLPTPRRRGTRRRLLDSDTSTSAQPGLFADRSTLSTPSPAPSEAPSVSDPPKRRDPNDSEMILTLSRGSGVGDGAGDGVGVSSFSEEGRRSDQGPTPSEPSDQRPSRTPPYLWSVPNEAAPELSPSEPPPPGNRLAEEAQDEAARARAARSRDLLDAVREAGGSHLIDK